MPLHRPFSDFNVNHSNIPLAFSEFNVIVINIEGVMWRKAIPMEQKTRVPKPGIAAALRALLLEMNQGSPWLTVTGLIMLADIALSIAGLIADPTLVTGAPAWLKPLKFGLSTCLFSFTVAFFISRLNKTRRLAAAAGRVMAAALVLEILLIDFQAARHTTSHFNQTSQFNSAIYGFMGLGIAAVLLTTLFLLVLTLIERFSDLSLGHTIRLSLALALAGMSTGILMTLPTPQQLADANAGRGLPAVGAHTVGARDGGPGLPITGWSADHGDLRIAHFVGLHAMQALLLGWWLTTGRRAWSQSRQLRLVWSIAIITSGVFATVLSQALRGLPILRPDEPIVTSWCACLLGTVLLSIWTALPTPAQTTQPLQQLR
jgi:hypothetical protein